MNLVGLADSTRRVRARRGLATSLVAASGLMLGVFAAPTLVLEACGS